MIKVFIIDNDIYPQQDLSGNVNHHEVIGITCYRDVQVPLDYLMINRRNHRDLPDVILLNLNIPCMAGWDFLHVADFLLPLMDKTIPILVTGSIREEDKYRVTGYSFVRGFIDQYCYETLVESLYNND